MPGSSFVAHRTQANEQSRGAGPRAGQINFDLPVAKSAAFQALYPVRPPGRVRRGVRGSGLFLAIAIREENASVPRGDEPKLSNSRAASGRAEVRSLKAESGSSSSAVLSQRGAPKYGRPYHRRWEYCPLKRTAQRLASLVVNQRGTISALCRNLEWKKSYRKSFGNLGRKTERVKFRQK